MKKVLFVGLIMAVSVVASNASDIFVTDAGVRLIRTQIEAQIERIQRARERAEARATLARMRAEEQLGIAEEDLTLQVERLEMLREQLCDQAGESEHAVVESGQNLKRIVERDVEKIGAEIRKANDLIRKLRMLRENGSTDSANGKSAGTGSACSDRSGRDFSMESTFSIAGLGGGAVGAETDSPSIAELEAMLVKIQQQQPVQNQPTPITALPPPPIVRTG
jgi:hypothetical protein